MKQLLNDLKNPKKKSIALLIIYAIFFAFVALLTRTSIANTPAVSSKEKSINSYEYNYIINDNENIKEVNGKYSNNSDNFIYNGLNYYKDKSGIYLDNNFVEIDFDVDLYKYDKMEKLIQNSEFVENIGINMK